MEYFFSEKVLPTKSLLPYSVVPRPIGRSEAERKIEELTRQLEEEMERNEEQGEYFGICHTCGDKVNKYILRFLVFLFIFHKNSCVY